MNNQFASVMLTNAEGEVTRCILKWSYDIQPYSGHSVKDHQVDGGWNQASVCFRGQTSRNETKRGTFITAFVLSPLAGAP